MGFKVGEIAVGVRPAGVRDDYLLDGEDVVIIKPLRKRRTICYGVTLCYIVKHVSGGAQDFYAKPEWLRKKLRELVSLSEEE